MADEAQANVQTSFQRLQQGEKVTAEIMSLHRDGTTFPVGMIATLDPADTGRVFIAVEDITAEWQRRSELEALDAECLRIAHEIQDRVVQSLAGLRFKSALWSHLADKASHAMRVALNELQAVLLR